MKTLARHAGSSRSDVYRALLPILALGAFFVGTATSAHTQASESIPALISPDPGKAVARVDGTEISLGNGALGFELTTENNKFRFAKFTDVLARKVVPVRSKYLYCASRTAAKSRRREWRLSPRPAWKTSKGIECFEARRQNWRQEGGCNPAIFRSEIRCRVEWNSSRRFELFTPGNYSSGTGA